jgi:hypothetical protein
MYPRIPRPCGALEGRRTGGGRVLVACEMGARGGGGAGEKGIRWRRTGEVGFRFPR